MEERQQERDSAQVKHTEVLIIGASMAGSCLARHLKLQHPDMQIMVIDRKSKFDFGVGESMVEVFWDYAAKDLQLGPYLDSNYISKHGMRFFFDSPEKDLALSEMSEMGRSWSDAIPAHQINRKRFDQDLCEMNLASGIEVVLNCAAEEIEIDADYGHVVKTSRGDSIRCKWLVDAAGFNAPLARKLDLVHPLEGHVISARWGRFRNVNVLDNVGTQEWRERVNFVSRFQSTTHFMYEGYWFWLIPIEEDLYSIGVVWRHDMVDIQIKNGEEFVAFIKGHRALGDILGDQYVVEDFHGHKNLARVSEQFYSTDRWFLTGMSAAFLDPLFSSSSAFLSDTNRMIVDLIETDMAGDKEALRNKVVCYNIHSHWWLENLMVHIKGNYRGSYDLMRQLFEPLLIDYFGLILPFSMARNWSYVPGVDYGDGTELRKQKRMMIEQASAQKVLKIADEVAKFLEEHEGLMCNNVGHYSDLKVTKSYNRHSLARGRTLSEEVIVGLQDEMMSLSIELALTRLAYSTKRHVSKDVLPLAIQAITEDGMSLYKVFETFSTALDMTSDPIYRLAEA
jgi:flavin-dependent dehydrogenase